MRSASRIAINTLASYGRTLFSVFLVLFSSRWVLAELGSSDYGIFSLVGTIVAIIVFINTILANSDARFFAISVGEESVENARQLFKTSLVLHITLPVIFLLFGEIIGEILIRNVLSIPEDRIVATLIVFRVSMFSSLVGLLAVPYNSLFIAYQDIVISSIVQLSQTFLLFASAFVLRFIDGDKLIFYTYFTSAINILVCFFYVLIAHHRYECCKKINKVPIDKDMMRGLLIYSFWNFLGNFGHLVRTQGVAIVVNLLYGTNGNAAIGIANQVSVQASNLTNALYGATSPEIYRRVGNNNHQGANSLSIFTTKVGLLFMIILAVPLIINMEPVLVLWLRDVPPNTGVLCCCYLIMYVIEKYSTGKLTMLQAINEVKTVQILIFVGYCLTVVLPYCGLCKHLGIAGIGLSCIITMALTRIGVSAIYYKFFPFNVKEYVINQILPVFLILLVAITLWIFNSSSRMSISMVALSCMISALLPGALYYYICFTREEKNRIFTLIKKHQE